MRLGSAQEGIDFRITPRRPLPIVEAKVNSLGPFHFILDTGASVTIITPGTAKAAGVRPTRQKPTAVGAGGPLPARLAKVKNLRVGTHVARNLEVALLDLGDVEKPLGIQLDGIIGYNFLRDYVVTIDYPHGKLYLHAVPRKPVRPGGR